FAPMRSMALAGNKRLIPVVHRDVRDEAVPERIAAHNWIFFREGDDFDAALEQVISALETDLEWVRAHTRLLVRATEWDERGRDRGYLLHGSDLQDAERALALAAGKRPVPTPLQTEYMYA